MRITVVSPNGLTVVEIDADDLPRYESLGYSVVTDEKEENDDGDI